MTNEHNFDAFFKEIKDKLNDAISEKPYLDKYIINVEKYGILRLEIKKAPIENRFNGYVVIHNTHPFIVSDYDVEQYVKTEDITFESVNEKKNEYTYGFDTLHVYNKIPEGMTPLVYTMERALRFVQNFIVPIAEKYGHEFVIKPLPENIFNDW